MMMMMILYYRFLSVDVHIETNKQNIATIKYSKSKCDLNICYKKHNVCVIETRKKNVVPRWVISISQTFTKHVDHGHGTQTCIEKNSFDKEKIACFKFRIPNNSCNQQQQPKTAQTMKCETCQRFFFDGSSSSSFLFCYFISLYPCLDDMMMMMVNMVEQIFFRFC